MGLLRFLFALSVVFAHIGAYYNFNLIGGKMAVQSFFMISGFYMALILTEKYKGKGRYFPFIRNRILRIYPLYLLVLSSIFIVSLVLSVSGSPSPTSELMYALTDYHLLTQSFILFVNIFIIGQDWAMFLELNEASKTLFFSPDVEGPSPFIYSHLLIPQAWTLSTELLFYAIAPFIVSRGRILLVLFAISIAIRFFIYSMGLHYEPWTNRFFPNELAFFILGVFAFRVYQKIRGIVLPKGMAAAAFASFLFFTLIYSYIPPIKTSILDIVQVIYFMSLAIFLPLIFLLFKDSRLDRKVGELSYPIYLSHLAVASVLTAFIPVVSPLYIIGVVTATVLLSYGLVLTVVRPIDRYRTKHKSISAKVDRPAFAVAAANDTVSINGKIVKNP